MEGYTLEDINKLAEKQRKKKKYRGWYEVFNAGNVPHNIEMFNQMSGASNSGTPSSLTGSCNGNPSSGGEVATTSMVESVQRWEKKFDNEKFAQTQKQKHPKTNYTLVFAEDEGGNVPSKAYLTWLESSNPALYAGLLYSIGMGTIQGPNLREPHSKSLGDGISEFGVCRSGMWARLLYFFDSSKIIVAVNGFNKDQSKTPTGEIEKARKLRDIYFRRKSK